MLGVDGRVPIEKNTTRPGRSEKGGIIFFELPECPLSSPLTAKNILPRQKSGKKSKIFFAAAKYFAVRGDDFCRWGA